MSMSKPPAVTPQERMTTLFAGLRNHQTISSLDYMSVNGPVARKIKEQIAFHEFLFTPQGLCPTSSEARRLTALLPEFDYAPITEVSAVAEMKEFVRGAREIMRNALFREISQVATANTGGIDEKYLEPHALPDNLNDIATGIYRYSSGYDVTLVLKTAKYAWCPLLFIAEPWEPNPRVMAYHAAENAWIKLDTFTLIGVVESLKDELDQLIRNKKKL